MERTFHLETLAGKLHAECAIILARVVLHLRPKSLAPSGAVVRKIACKTLSKVKPYRVNDPTEKTFENARLAIPCAPTDFEFCTIC